MSTYTLLAHFLATPLLNCGHTYLGTRMHSSLENQIDFSIPQSAPIFKNFLSFLHEQIFDCYRSVRR